jgi:hypothetical protein
VNRSIVTQKKEELEMNARIWISVVVCALSNYAAVAFAADASKPAMPGQKAVNDGVGKPGQAAPASPANPVNPNVASEKKEFARRPVAKSPTPTKPDAVKKNRAEKLKERNRQARHKSGIPANNKSTVVQPSPAAVK